MKRTVKILGAVGLGILLLFSDCIHVNAQNYYDTKYNNRNTKKPYIKVNKKIAEIEADDHLGKRKGYRSSSRKDFNGDGKKEKVVLSAKGYYNKNNDLDSKMILKINSKVAIAKKELGYHYNISFSTMKVQGKCLAVLMYGDEDYAGGGAMIYLWKNNHKLKLLKSYKSKGYLYIYSARDKDLNKTVLYIEDNQQLFNANGEKWPSKVLKKYHKYANEMSTSVTKSTYHKYVYKNGRLKRVGKDNYFRVSEAYD